jgi:L-alanine-DL-glutamate epimerase-like enolase superfamily enzyme
MAREAAVPVKLSYEILELETRHEFHIARAGAPPARRNVWVRLHDNDIEGWGEAAPNAYYLETADTVSVALERMRAVLLRAHALELDAISPLERELATVAPAAASARAAISAALFDIAGKRSGQPVYELLGLRPAQMQRSSFTIGIDTVEAMRHKVREARSYPILKIKVGTPHDEAILTMLREERPDAVIRVDANTAWTRDEALRHLPMLAAYGVELIEQPLHPDDLDGLAAVRAAASVPVIADESCRFASDVERLAGCVDGVNIKLAKCGSLLEATRIAAAARQHGMQIMIGCMIESTLGIAAGIHLASLAAFVDLDGAALLARDYFTGPHMDTDGMLHLEPAPGLGVTV